MGAAEWFLTGHERGNPAYRHPDWCAGNDVRAHVHGSTYFARLAAEVALLRPGDHLFFTDWAGDADELSYNGPENRLLGEEVRAAGGEVLLDARVCCAPTTRSGPATRSRRAANGRWPGATRRSSAARSG